MSGHTTDECYTIECIVQDLIDSRKLKDLEESPKIKTSPLSKYQDVPHTENKSLPNYPVSLQPPSEIGITSSRPHESHGSDGAHASQILPNLYKPASDHHEREKRRRTMENYPL